MEVELTDHLGFEPHLEPPGGTGNARNGTTPKTLMTEHGPVQIDTPRDRNGSFAPQIVRKRQRRFEGFDEKVLALYSRGLSTRGIEAHLAEIYGVKVGRDLISRVTDAVMDDARAWQSRPLEDVYPVVFLDCMILKIRDGGSVQRRACYLALAIGMDGEREVLGMWFQANEGAKFWMQVGPADTRDRAGMAKRVGARHTVHGVPARGPQGDLHHERDRGAQPAATKGSQDQGALPDRGRREEADLPRDRKRGPQWTKTRGWTKALLAFKIHFDDRLPD